MGFYFIVKKHLVKCFLKPFFFKWLLSGDYFLKLLE